MTKLTVGQKLSAVSVEGYSRRDVRIVEATVTKVGRKWADIDIDGQSWAEWRVDMETMCAKSVRFTGEMRCYVDIAEYHEERAQEAAWRDMRQAIDRQYNPPQHLTSAQITAMVALIMGDAWIERTA